VPIFVYQCTACEEKVERLLPSSDATLDSHIICPWCSGDLVRVPAASNFTVKGHNAKNGYSSKG